MSSNNGIWYSFFDRGNFKGSEPYFYNPADFEWTKHLEANWLDIREELDQLIRGGDQNMQAYFDKAMVDVAQTWKTIPFFWWGIKFNKYCSQTPKTTALLESVPGMLSASFNMLDGNSVIKPHNGDTNAIVRCHLGLHIPAPLPEAGFRVGTEQKSWEEGKFLIFCDAHEHTAWNNSPNRRYILLMDVMLPKHAAQTSTIQSNVIGSLFLQSAAQKLPFLYKLPMIAQVGLHFFAKNAAKIALPLWNALDRMRYKTNKKINPA
ncbi:MAG: aspartyl/asparaginyl beta-hydroxylase domain-containing protein [Chitinophagales bacterium]|jgi:hypothetical protein|nr:aspartyl/asparaginyl beta-hydroxylase domain-containing protein [Chitinophagales bacterium]